MTTRRFGERSPELIGALAAASDPRDVTLGLPERVDGASEFTIVTGDYSGSVQAWDVAFDWDGNNRYATYWFDISGHEDLSPGSSAPVNGWVAWQSDASVVIAFTFPEMDVHGVAWGADLTMIDAATNDTTTAPLDWATFARYLIDHVNAVLQEDEEHGRLLGPGVSG